MHELRPLVLANLKGKKDATVLELGCGHGRLANSIAGDVGKLVLVDFYNAPEQMPKNAEFIQQDLENINLAGKYDLIIINQTLEHIKNPLGLMMKTKELLAPRGRIIVSVPNRRGFHNEAKVWYSDDGKHYFIWDRESLEFSLNRIGYNCRFSNLYMGSSRGGIAKFIGMLFRIESPILTCTAMVDE